VIAVLPQTTCLLPSHTCFDVLHKAYSEIVLRHQEWSPVKAAESVVFEVCEMRCARRQC
jgi:hypothetical protein